MLSKHYLREIALSHLSVNSKQKALSHINQEFSKNSWFRNWNWYCFLHSVLVITLRIFYELIEEFITDIWAINFAEWVNFLKIYCEQDFSNTD